VLRSDAGFSVRYVLPERSGAKSENRQLLTGRDQADPSMSAARSNPAAVGNHGRYGFLAALFVLAAASATPAFAQQIPSGVLAAGNAAVSGFSGANPPVQIPPGVDPAEKTFIDIDGPSLRIVDLAHMGGPPAAQLVAAPKPTTWFAAQIGQVFAVAVDNAGPPNIYAAATSAYGLPIVAPGSDGAPVHVRTGAPSATFMPGLWGRAAGGGPGAIWKIDGVTGAVSLFADVKLDGRPNSGPALGGLAFDPDSSSLYVADRETGFIHRFAMDGSARGRFDHGTAGRQGQGLPPVAFDPGPTLDITSAKFDSAEPATWNYAAPERRLFGLAVYKHRLYYAVAAGLQIWSVGLGPDGSFGNDATLEVAVPPGAGPTEISKIAFDEQGRMVLAERPAPTGAFDFGALTPQGIGRVLRYANAAGADPNAELNWQPEPDEYAIGFPLDLRNGNGGVDIGYLYKPNGDIDLENCGGYLWSTGERCANRPMRCANPVRRMSTVCRATAHGASGATMSRRCSVTSSTMTTASTTTPRAGIWATSRSRGCARRNSAPSCCRECWCPRAYRLAYRYRHRRRGVDHRHRRHHHLLRRRAIAFLDRFNAAEPASASAVGLT